MTAGGLSIQPWARKNGEEGSLKDVLARVNFERGHFRDITETSLQEEIAADGALELSESDDEDEVGDGEREAEKALGPPTTREELYKAKYEMLANVRAAEQDILMSLDFISLLLSKDAPKQAAATVSPFLKEAVPLGSLGTDLWQRMPVDKLREAQDDLLATNVKMEGLQHSADNLLSAARRLEGNVRKETEYWNQVLSISEKGWTVCRIPGQQHRLAVRYGFSESAPEFSRRGLAALTPSTTGNIMLERGIGRKPKSLHVTIRKHGTIVGTSKMPAVLDSEETTLESRIRHARDSLYDEELYHEMIRESRALSALGIGMKGSAICFRTHSMADENSDISLDLVASGELQNPHFDMANREDRLAEATLLAARLLLSQAHRDRLKKRSAVPHPLSDKQKDDGPLLPILRPILAFTMHQDTLRNLNNYIDNITRILQSANIEVSSSAASFELPRELEQSNADALISILLQPWSSKAHIKLKDSKDAEIEFTFKIQTELASPNSFASVVTFTYASDVEVYRFERFPEVVAAVDGKLSSVLANALLEIAGDGWACEENEALLTRDAGAGKEGGTLSVEVAAGRRTISLNSGTAIVSWASDGNNSEGFWIAAGELMQVADSQT